MSNEPMPVMPTWEPLSELPTGPTFRLEVMPFSAPPERPGVIDVRVWLGEHGDFIDADNDSYAAIRAAYKALGTPSGGMSTTEKAANGERFTATYIGAYRLWFRDLHPDRVTARRVLAAAAAHTTDSSISTWLTRDEEGTWARKVRDLFLEAARNVASDALTEAQLEQAIAAKIALLALWLEASLARRQNAEQSG